MTNKVYTGLHIPVYRTHGSELIKIYTPGSLCKQSFRVMSVSFVGFLASAITLCVLVDDLTQMSKAMLACITMVSLMGIMLGFNYEETLIHMRTRKMRTVERPVIITDDFDGLSICTGTIHNAIESEKYFILTISRKGNQTYAYIAPKREMTEGEMDCLRNIIMYQIPNYTLIGETEGGAL